MAEPFDKSSVRKGWLLYIAVMLAFYALIKIFGEPSSDAPHPSAPTSQTTGEATR